MESVGKDQQEKLAQLQTHLRLSTDETKDAVRDLNNWEDEMRAKDAALRGGKDDDKKAPTTKPSKKRCRKARTDDNKPIASKASRIKGTDYQQWEKFSELDEHESTTKKEEDTVYCSSDCDCDKDGGSGDRVEQDRIFKQQKFAQRAALEKDKGNAYFGKKKYSEAIKCYTDGIGFDSSNTLLYANRAQALLKIKKFSAAEQDCTKAISLDSSFAKAYFRRGLARMELNKVGGAKEDFEAVLRFDPTNAEAQKFLRHALQSLTIANAETGECKESLSFPEGLRGTGPDVEAVSVEVKFENDKRPPAAGKVTVLSETAITDRVGDLSGSKNGAKVRVKKETSGSAPTPRVNTDGPPAAPAAATINKSFVVPAGPAPPPRPYFEKDSLKRPTTIQEFVSAMQKFKGNVELIQFYCRKVTHLDTPQYLYQELGTGLDFQLFSKLVLAYEQLLDADEKLDCYKHLCGLQGARRLRALCYGLKPDMRQRLAAILTRLLEDEEWMQPPPPLSVSVSKAERDAEDKKYGIYGPHTIANELPQRKRQMVREMVESFYLQDYAENLP